ncbi:hypothetical protein Tco_1115560 [Tanacetum coccineum]
MPEDIKVPLILRRPFLSSAHAKIDVFKRKITLRLREEKIIFKSVKPASSLIKRVYMLSLRERMELDLEARLTRETLVLNRSMDPLYGDYIELNDLNIPLELRRHQVDDLMPTIEECEVIEEFRTGNDARMISKIFGYPSDYDQVVESMDPYVDEGIGEVVIGKSFCEVSCVEAKGLMESLLSTVMMKVSKEDKMNGISHSYQKLKSFYKGVLNLGPNLSEIHQWKNGSHAGTTSLKEKKSTILVENLRSGNFEVLES